MPAKSRTFSGHKYLRYRLILATLSGKTIRIENIRPEDDEDGRIGLRDSEINFMKLLEKVTNGSVFDINYTGTSLIYRPGIILGGNLEHDCGNDRAIGYYLEPLLALAPFSKNKFELVLNGITNDPRDLCVDTIKACILPQLAKFGLHICDITIKSRGAPPNGGGKVAFTCSTVRSLKPVQNVDEGLIKRIRGYSYATRVSPQMSNRMIDSAKSLLNRFIPDVYIYSDVCKGPESGNSPGYGLTLIAESNSGVLVSAECMAKPGDNPEDVGLTAAKILYQEISLGGCVDTTSQWINLLLMCLGPEDLSKITVGKLSQFSIQFLRDLKKFFGVTFKLTAKQNTQKKSTISLACIGVGYVNINKKTT